MKIKSNFYVITGGPGVGKTSLIDALQISGVNCVPEVARQIIREQIECAGNALPWGDKALYSDMMLKKSISDFINLSDSGQIHFFDRGIPDTYAYNRLINLEIGSDLATAVADYRYNPTVFILPPWKEIYCGDSERKQDFQEAIDTYRVMKITYKQLGYTLLEVPKLTIEERCNFILKYLNLI